MKRYNTYLLYGLLALVTLVAHGVNMFNYPYFENDEGTYMSQAYALSEQGALAPYTYWYDHAPVGWATIALWANSTGGFFTFGTSIDSGRVFMLLVHLLGVLLLFFIIRRITHNTAAALFAGLLFACSPLMNYYGRRVLLDPIMTTWVLASIAVLYAQTVKLRHFMFSGLFLAIAVLSKEPAIFFVPGVLYLAWTRTTAGSRLFSLGLWTSMFGIVTSLYPLYALLKGELFPSGTRFGGDEPHVSLMETLQFQATRGAEGAFWQTGSDFQTYFAIWMDSDPVLLVLGTVASVLLIILSVRHSLVRPFAVLTTLYWAFLLHGGILINFYILPLIPFLAGALALVVNWCLKTLRVKGAHFVYASVYAVLFIAFATSYAERSWLYVKDETTPQREAIAWVQRNVPKDAFVLIDNYAFVDLRQTHPDAHYYWKAEHDPAVRNELLDNDWRNIDYILRTPQIAYDALEEQFAIISPALNNAETLAAFESDNYRVSVERVLPVPAENILATSWKHYARTFIREDGRVVDPYTANRTTSEGQSYAMLRAAWAGDRATFDRVWAWTRTNLGRPDDALYAWRYENGRVQDYGVASDADEDIALALLLASERWNEPTYRNEAHLILEDLWNNVVVKTGDIYVFTASANAQRPDGYLVNPSYFAPASYRVFAEYDTTKPWGQLADDTYILLTRIHARHDSAYGNLPPNWIIVTENGDIASAEVYVGEDADRYGYDAFRLYWRVALDAQWHEHVDARTYLEYQLHFWRDEWDAERLLSVYSHQGAPRSTQGNISTDTGIFALFTQTDALRAKNLYLDRIHATYNEQGYWEEPSNYYGQNWAWFATALYSNALTAPQPRY